MNLNKLKIIFKFSYSIYIYIISNYCKFKIYMCVAFFNLVKLKIYIFSRHIYSKLYSKINYSPPVKVL